MLETVILPRSNRGTGTMLAELWAYRDLLMLFIRRSISVRYKQTALGVAWALLQPTVSAAIFSVVFGLFAKFPSGGVPYILFVFSGMMSWQYISRNISEGAAGFVNQAGLMSKVYFPRIMFGLIPLGYGAFDFILSMGMLMVMCAILGVAPSPMIIMVPVVLLLSAAFSYGIGLILAPINALYRDVSMIVPFGLQIAMYLSPVAYSQEIVPEKYHWIVELNPIATLVTLMRSSIFGQPLPSAFAIGWMLFTTVTLLYAGLKTVAAFEETIVDRI